VAVQRRALERASIDVVVGSSFGGAVALELLQSGRWNGPTVLLCPAHERVAHRAKRPAPPSLASLDPSLAARVLVVHGAQDTIVPIEHSRRLVAGSRARLIEVDDDHPLTATSSGEQLRAWIEMTLEPTSVA
jgi:pimeloyl-ACP methyl ester carboxylesterase